MNQNQETNQAASRKLKIVLLEDDEMLRHLYERLIRGWQRKVDLIVSRDGYEVWWEILRSQPDLLITDEYHDGLHGNVIISHLARHKSSCAVLWTAADNGRDLTEVFGSLRYEVLPKPFAKKHFLEKLDNLVAALDD